MSQWSAHMVIGNTLLQSGENLLSDLRVRYQSRKSALDECCPTQRAPDWWESARFQAFAWLEVGSGKMALSRPAHQRVTHTVRLAGRDNS